MPGSLWFPFRQGNRNEYLALYILSALGVVIKVPREEDIGADFYCTLANKDGNRMTFHTPFLIQTKSSSESKVSYGGIDKKGRWKNEEVDWLFSQELPLLIGLVDREALNLKLYTTSNMWSALYGSGKPGEIVLKPNVFVNPREPVSPNEVKEWPAGVGDGMIWEVPLGRPLVSISVNDSEDIEKINVLKNNLIEPLRLEQENITYRRLNVHYSKWPSIYETNKLHKGFKIGASLSGNETPGANTDNQIKSLVPIITVLAFNYKLQEQYSSLEKLKPIVSLIPECPELDRLKDAVPELF